MEVCNLFITLLLSDSKCFSVNAIGQWLHESSDHGDEVSSHITIYSVQNNDSVAARLSEGRKGEPMDDG